MTRHGRNIMRLAGIEALSDADVAAEKKLMRRALAIWQETGDAAGTARALFGVSLVFQVLRGDWDGGMPYLWQAFGLAEAVEESGDLYGASEIHRHVGFYYLYSDLRPREAVRRLGHSLALREQLGDCAGCPARWSRSARRSWPRATPASRRVPVPGGRAGPRRRPAALADPGRRTNPRRGRGGRPRGRLTPQPHSARGCSAAPCGRVRQVRAAARSPARSRASSSQRAALSSS